MLIFFAVSMTPRSKNVIWRLSSGVVFWVVISHDKPIPMYKTGSQLTIIFFIPSCILGTTVVLGVDRNGGLNGTSAGGDDVLLVQQFNR